MMIVELSMSPLGRGASVSKYVARCLDIIDRSGLDYRLGPMGTCIEGEFERVMAVVGRCLASLRKDCDRVSISIKADWRRGKERRLDSKVRSVERQVGRKLRTRTEVPGS